MKITHNKNRIPILNLLINCISARSAHNILSMKDEYTFRFSNFLIICLCNPSANSHVANSKGCWFDIFSFLTETTKADLSAREAYFS